MKKLLSIALTTTATLGLGASAALAQSAVKVECNGNCNNILLSNVCSKVNSVVTPYFVACDDISGGGTFNACAGTGASCHSEGQVTGNDAVGHYCADGPGYDAIVICK